MSSKNIYLSCQLCSKPFKKFKDVTHCSISCSNITRGIETKRLREEKYYKNPRICKNCSNIIDIYGGLKYCSRKCAAECTSKIKDYSKFRSGPLPTGKKKSDFQVFKDNICGPYTRIYLCKCKVSGITWYSKTMRKIHPSQFQTKSEYSLHCRFSFSIKTYPEYFAYANELINRYGWYSASNRGGNLNGCSRDHMYSVSDGYKNNISSTIISHPANCRIITNRENQQKRAKSSISLQDLYYRIDEFNKRYGVI